MVRNPIVALLLGLVPGLGHFAVNRKGRGFIYPFLFLGILGVGFLIAVAEGDGVPLVFAAFVALFIWLINILDLVIYLLRHNNGNRMGGVLGAPYDHGYAGGVDAPYTPADMPLGSPPPPPLGAHERAYGYGGAYPGGPMPVNPRRDDAGERFYTILLSFVPGLGHLQLGLMQRGLTLLIGFFGLLTMIMFVSILANEDGFLVFLVALPIVWLYGMFDAIRLVQRKHAGEQLVDRSIMDDWDEHRQGGKRSRWFATVLSILPGAGHMYLGQQKRGLQLMAGFLLSIYLLDVLQLSLFLFIVPIIWCFSFFDSLQQQSRYAAEDGRVEDVPVVDWLMHRQKWIGITLLLLGLYYMADRLLIDFIQRIFDNFQLTSDIRYYLKTGFTSLLLVAAGIKLLVSGTKSRGDSSE
ncbi:hypothetical protein [Paenibacillus mendelii]|uniref:Multi-tm2 domain protein n=1 Tax=Paenibacillus mendelii TaxID=206163 RepID=A0ABV6J658_9BACL|nr:hypothetical protein [Paenibacillus mendelii]MCQ6561879.1 hypothetical protein [Paenibacillus mendelii]